MDIIKKIIRKVIKEEKCPVEGCDRFRSTFTPTLSPCNSPHPHIHDGWDGDKCNVCGTARTKTQSPNSISPKIKEFLDKRGRFDPCTHGNEFATQCEICIKEQEE